MIKRIQKIIGVGPFSNFKNGGQYQFDSITLIFGLNTYGKSTLSDIFRSLDENNGTILTKRQTIGMNTQEVILSYLLNTDQREQQITFKKGKWYEKDKFPFKIEVFDTKFVEKNVFTGLTITRENKERLTDFVLGEEGVNLANEIKELKKQRDNLNNNEIKNLEKDIEKEIKKFSMNLDDFIKINVQLNEESRLEQEIKDLEKKIKKLEENKENIESILNIEIPLPININFHFSTLFAQFNDLLEKNYKELNQEILNKIDAHINSVFKKKDNKEEEWIRKGFYYIKGDKNSACPFCGQPLNQSELFSLYQKYFSEGYTKFLKEVETGLSYIEGKIIDEYNKFINDVLKIYEPIEKLDKAKNYIDDTIFFQKSEIVKDTINKLKKKLDKYKAEIDNMLQNFKEKKAKKLQTLYNRVEPLNFSNILKIEKEIETIVENVNTDINDVSTVINDFKKDYQIPSNLENELQELKKNLKEKKVKMLRLDLFDKCEKLKKLYEDLENIRIKINQKEEELQKNQEKFISKYFEKVNELFDSFGSNNFKINKKIERRGYKNTVTLEIVYHDKPIALNEIEYVLSDSDKRALAFSIFLAKLEKLGDERLRNTIVVLDDPVTSFDDNRKKVTVIKIKELARKVRQVIILSHYNDFLKELLISFNNNYNYSFYKIKRTNTGSEFDRTGKDFLRDEHEKNFIKIKRFIEAESIENISKDLRIFFENEIKIRYRLLIYDKNLQDIQLAELIDKLFEYNAIDKEQHSKLHDFREQLNPEYHRYIGNCNEEDIRNFAKLLLKYIYDDL